MAVITHGELESLDPIVEEVSAAYRLLGRGVLWARLPARPMLSLAGASLPSRPTRG